MRKRDIGVALIVLAIAIFLFWFVILGGANPFVPHLNVKITAGVDCGAAWMCWFNEQVKLEYSPSTSIFTISPMPLQWYCGIGGGPKNLEFKLRVENPDNSVNEYRQEIGTCQDIDLVASFKVPLDKGCLLYTSPSPRD